MMVAPDSQIVMAATTIDIQVYITEKKEPIEYEWWKVIEEVSQ